jgi:hypothetical protein
MDSYACSDRLWKTLFRIWRIEGCQRRMLRAENGKAMGRQQSWSIILCQASIDEYRLQIGP